MSNFILEITEPTKNIIEIETSFSVNINNIEIERFDATNLEVVNTEKILAFDLPDNIPMSKIVGNLDVSRIDNLNTYLNSYEFDCGSP